MMLEEMQARLKKEKINTQEQLWTIKFTFILLDIHKDDFCKIIDTVGLEVLMNKQNYYDRLIKAENELAVKRKGI